MVDERIGLNCLSLTQARLSRRHRTPLLAVNRRNQILGGPVLKRFFQRGAAHDTHREEAVGVCLRFWSNERRSIDEVVQREEVSPRKGQRDY